MPDALSIRFNHPQDFLAAQAALLGIGLRFQGGWSDGAWRIEIQNTPTIKFQDYLDYFDSIAALIRNDIPVGGGYRDNAWRLYITDPPKWYTRKPKLPEFLPVHLHRRLAKTRNLPSSQEASTQVSIDP